MQESSIIPRLGDQGTPIMLTPTPQIKLYVHSGSDGFRDCSSLLYQWRELKHRIQVDLEGLSQNLEMIRAQGGDLINPYDSVT